MKTYYGTKVVQAYPEKSSNTGEPGYAVIYQDGYQSWSPKDVFEKAYQSTDKMSFGHAILAMKSGKKVARANWNGKNMFLYFVPAAKYPADRNAEGAMIGFFPDDWVPYRDYIAMLTAQGDVVPWVASQSDILVDDWYIVES